MKPEVLIIDQEGSLRQSLATRLEEEGYRVFDVENSGDVEEIVSQCDIDVVLLGLGHLKRDAFSALEQIKDIRPGAEVILLNTGEDIHLSIEGMKLGAFDDIFPPFDLGVITGRVKAAWDQKKKTSKAEEKARPFPLAINRFVTTVGLSHVKLWYGQAMDHFMEFELGHS